MDDSLLWRKRTIVDLLALMRASRRVPSRRYYAEYHGHRPEDLHAVLEALRGRSERIVFFAGDSSLDNKYWVADTADAVNGYEDVLEPPQSVMDVCYWTNRVIEEMKLGGQIACVNTAIEETTLAQRERRLFVHDQMIRECIQEEDVLVVSVGGNDIALRPSIATVFNILSVVYFSNEKSIKEGSFCGLKHFKRLFKDRVQAYVEKLVGRAKPKLILVCMIYYPALQGDSWAGTSLSLLNYNKKPQVLQSAIKSMFEYATSNIRIPGSRVVPVPLFDFLDPTCARDYISRVEPSAQGGEKMARGLMRIIKSELFDEATKQALESEA